MLFFFSSPSSLSTSSSFRRESYVLRLRALLLLPKQLNGTAFKALVRVSRLRAKPLSQASKLLQVLFVRALNL